MSNSRTTLSRRRAVVAIAVILPIAAIIFYVVFVPVSPDWAVVCPPSSGCPFISGHPPMVSLTYSRVGIGGITIDGQYQFFYRPWGCHPTSYTTTTEVSQGTTTLSVGPLTGGCDQGVIGGSALDLLVILSVMAVVFGVVLLNLEGHDQKTAAQANAYFPKRPR